MGTSAFDYFFVVGEHGCRPWSYLVYYETCIGVYFHFSPHTFFPSVFLFCSNFHLYECSFSIMSFFRIVFFFQILYFLSYCGKELIVALHLLRKFCHSVVLKDKNILY